MRHAQKDGKAHGCIHFPCGPFIAHSIEEMRRTYPWRHCSKDGPGRVVSTIRVRMTVTTGRCKKLLLRLCHLRRLRADTQGPLGSSTVWRPNDRHDCIGIGPCLFPFSAPRPVWYNARTRNTSIKKSVSNQRQQRCTKGSSAQLNTHTAPLPCFRPR